jgi:DNA polymerase III delta prime subunit
MYNDDFLWCEKYRPKTVSECILPDSIKNTFQEYVNKKEIPNLLLTGQAGSGKTSLAKALCNEVGCDYLFLNGSSENGIDTFRTKITNYASSVSLSGGKKVIIIDEADFLTPQVFAALRAGIESFSKNCTFILTGNFKNKFPEAIQSRCSSIDFSIGKDDKKNLITQFFKRVCNILDKEDIEYDKPSVAEFITKYFPDNRKILNELQRYSVSGKIDVGILSQVGDINLKDLIKFMKDKDFAKVREWINLNLNNDYNGVYRKLYDGMYSFLKPNSIPQVVLIIAKYQYQTGFVADPEIQMLACMTEIMVESDFK